MISGSETLLKVQIRKLQREKRVLKKKVAELQLEVDGKGQDAGGAWEAGKVDCDVCGGEGKVQATCSECRDDLTTKNVACPFGEEGDDICKSCARADADVVNEGKY